MRLSPPSGKANNGPGICRPRRSGLRRRRQQKPNRWNASARLRWLKGWPGSTGRKSLPRNAHGKQWNVPASTIPIRTVYPGKPSALGRCNQCPKGQSEILPALTIRTRTAVPGSAASRLRQGRQRKAAPILPVSTIPTRTAVRVLPGPAKALGAEFSAARQHVVSVAGGRRGLDKVSSNSAVVDRISGFLSRAREPC